MIQVSVSKNNTKTNEDFSISNPEKREELSGPFDHLRIDGQDDVQRLKNAGLTLAE